MATADPTPQLTTELTAALDTLDPEVRGLHYIELISSPDLKAAVREQIVARERRQGLIHDVLGIRDEMMTALTALYSDGYPAEVADATVIASLFEQLQEEQRDLSAAMQVFQEQASAGTVSLGTPSPKPTQP